MLNIRAQIAITNSYTKVFENAVTGLRTDNHFISPEITKKGRLNFNVEVTDKPNRLSYLTYNIQTGFFDIHVSKVTGLNTEKALRYVRELEDLISYAEDLNGEIEIIRENIDIKNGR